MRKLFVILLCVLLLFTTAGKSLAPQTFRGGDGKRNTGYFSCYGCCKITWESEVNTTQSGPVVVTIKPYLVIDIIKARQTETDTTYYKRIEGLRGTYYIRGESGSNFYFRVQAHRLLWWEIRVEGCETTTKPTTTKVPEFPCLTVALGTIALLSYVMQKKRIKEK